MVIFFDNTDKAKPSDPSSPRSCTSCPELVEGKKTVDLRWGGWFVGQNSTFPSPRTGTAIPESSSQAPRYAVQGVGFRDDRKILVHDRTPNPL